VFDYLNFTIYSYKKRGHNSAGMHNSCILVCY